MDAFWGDVMLTVRPAALFTLHSLIGIVLFIIVALCAAAVHWLTQWIDTPPLVTLVLTGLACLLFAIDVLCLVVFIIKECLVFIQDVIGHPLSFSAGDMRGKVHWAPPAGESFAQRVHGASMELRASVLSFLGPLIAVIRDVVDSVNRHHSRAS